MTTKDVMENNNDKQLMLFDKQDPPFYRTPKDAKQSMKSPIQWFGGKGNFVKHLLVRMPHHMTYVSVFGGGGSDLFAKKPSAIEIYNDIDQNLYELFTVLQDAELFEQFRRKVEATPYSRQMYYECREKWGGETDLITRVWRWFVLARQSFAGRFGHSWGYSRSSSYRGMSGQCSQWLSAIGMLPEVHARLMRVQIECDDFRKILERYDTPDTLFYCDPPYVLSARKSGGYAHEMTDDGHRDLVDMLIGVQGKVMLSAYPNDMYNDLLNHGWSCDEIKTSSHAAGRTQGSAFVGEGSATENAPRVECIWMNYSV